MLFRSPVIDVQAKFAGSAPAKAGDAPPTDIDLTLSGKNMTASAPLRLAAGQITSRAEITARIGSAVSALAA